MKRIQIAALLVAGFLIWQPEVLTFLAGQAPEAGYDFGELGSRDRLTVLFWSAVVFVFYFVRFENWATVRPPDFAHTPTRHCTTHSRYLFARLSYAAGFVAVFWVLIFVPQLLDLIRQAIELLLSGGSDVTPEAFSDPALQQALGGTVRPLHELGPAQVAPYVCVLLLLVYPKAKIPVVGEQRVRAFFQERALIPREAHRHIDRIGDARGEGVFCPDEAVLESLADGPLRGLVDLDRYPGDLALHDIVLAEYLCARIGADRQTGIGRARRDSDFEELCANIEQARKGLSELVDDSRELIKALETDEASEVQTWRIQVGKALETLEGQSQELMHALGNAGGPDADDWAVLIDRVRQNAQKLQGLLRRAETELRAMDTLMVLDEDAAYDLGQTRDRLRAWLQTQDDLRARLTQPSDALEAGLRDNLGRLSDELDGLSTRAEAVAERIDRSARHVEQEQVTLDWVERYRRALKPGTRQRVFSRAMDNRRREVLDVYRTLRAQMTRLLATLILASDSSPIRRERHLRDYGFSLKSVPGSGVRGQQYVMPLTFTVVFVLCLTVTLSYMLGYELFERIGQPLFALSAGPDTLPAGGRLDLNLQVQEPKRAVFWALVASLLQMFAVGMALLAWNLLTDDERSAERRGSRSTLLINAWFNGFVFGFVGGVLAFYLLGLLPHPTNPGQMIGHGLLKQAWPWAILAGVTGGFLLVQAVHLRDRASTAFMLTVLVQGLVSCVVGVGIAWVWGYEQVSQPVLGAFSLYAGLNMLVLGMALGFIARYFMQSDELEIGQNGCGEATQEAGPAVPQS